MPDFVRPPRNITETGMRLIMSKTNTVTRSATGLHDGKRLPVSTQNKNGFIFREISHGLPSSDTLRPALFQLLLLVRIGGKFPTPKSFQDEKRLSACKVRERANCFRYEDRH